MNGTSAPSFVLLKRQRRLSDASVGVLRNYFTGESGNTLEDGNYMDFGIQFAIPYNKTYRFKIIKCVLRRIGPIKV